MAGKDYTEMERLRSYSSIFSRSVFSDIIEYDDYTRLNILLERYNNSQKHFQTYLDYIKYAYHTIARKYRCEYVYKNEIISKLLIRKYGTKNTIALNEFRVRNSIVDFALFNWNAFSCGVKLGSLEIVSILDIVILSLSEAFLVEFCDTFASAHSLI